MSDFTLQCWVPSLSSYTRVNELNMGQYGNIAKYILNNDDIGLAEYFEKIIETNFLDKLQIESLTKFDKWFIITFFRAINISPTLTLKAIDPTGKECTYDIDLLSILTTGSEFIPKQRFVIKLNTLEIEIDNIGKIYNNGKEFNFIKSITTNNKKILLKNLSLQENKKIINEMGNEIINAIKDLIKTRDKFNNSLKLISKNSILKGVYEMPLSLFDNTVFDFLKLIYSPFARGVYAKKYFLMSKIGFSGEEVDKITPLECDIYINLYNQENNSKIKAGHSNQ